MMEEKMFTSKRGIVLVVIAAIIGIYWATSAINTNNAKQDVALTVAALAATQKAIERANAQKLEDLAKQCTLGADALTEDAHIALKNGDYQQAISILAPCRQQLTGVRAKGILDKAEGAASIALAKLERDRKARVAKAEAAEKAERKRHGVSIGMNKQDALDSSWGRPQRVNRTITAGGEREQWVYGGNNYLYFENGKLTSVQN